jgi:peptide/nickel transport system permease protein
MRLYLLKRLLLTLPVLIGVSVLVFLFIHLIPGDPVEVMLGESASPADRAALRHQLHLDQPLSVQFGLFFSGLATGKLESIFYREPVSRKVFARLGATFELALAAMALSCLFAIPLGIVAALRRGRWADSLSTGFALLGVSIPNFWLGPMLILVFSLKLGWLPVSGRGGLYHLALPALTLGLAMAALLSRMTRASLLEALSEPHLTAARARGLSEPRVILKHALRNAGVPILTIIGLQFGALLSGAIITETIFAWPGLGRLLIEAIQTRDFPLVQGSVLAIALTYVMVNLITDLLYTAVDPRVRLEGRA